MICKTGIAKVVAMEQDKLKKVITLLRNHHIELNAPATAETVRQIEKQYYITLPEEYVSFITMVGNGGILPDSSGLKQLSWYLNPIEQCDFEKAAVPFPFTEAWDWSHDDIYDCTTDPEGKIAATQYGHFAIVAPDDGEGYTWNLIVNGPCKGEVWEFTDWKMCRGRSVTFLDWVLDCVEQGFQQNRYEDPEDRITNSLDARFEHIRKRLKRKKAILNPVISVEQCLEIEHKYDIKLPKEYVYFLTKIGNGLRLSDDTFSKFIFPLEHNDLTNIGQPFPLEDTWVFTTNQCQHPETDHLYNISVDADKVWDKVHHGYITLATEKKRNLPIEQAFLLIITGARAKEIWCLSYNTAKGQGDFGQLGEMSFIDWLEDYINGFSF